MGGGGGSSSSELVMLVGVPTDCSSDSYSVSEFGYSSGSSSEYHVSGFAHGTLT